MVNQRYCIRGFDCAVCAEKSERHLNLDPRVEHARIDYIGETLYLSSQEGLSEEEIKAIIAEVESDPIEISAHREEKKERVDKEDIILGIRVALAIAIFFLNGFLFKDAYWIRFAIYLAGLLLIEYDLAIQVVKNIVHKQNPLDEYLLILLASTGAFVLAHLSYSDTGSAKVIGNDVFMMEAHYEAILVCLLWQIGELLQSFAVKKSRNAIVSAVSKRVEQATLIDGVELKRVDASSLRVGDHVLVAESSIVPVDGVVVSGSAYCDTSSLNGESLPIALKEGDAVYGGTTITSGEVEIEATKDYASSSAAKILDLVSSSLEKKGKAEKTITKFARVYTPVIFGIAVVYILIAGFLGPSWKSAVYTGLEILVISCPCALVISVPLAYFAAVGLASKHSIVVKGAAHLDSLSRVKTVAMDKTGTLTSGHFAVASSHVEEGVDEEAFLQTLVSLEAHSEHPIAVSIVKWAGVKPNLQVTSYRIEKGQGIEGVIDGVTYRAGNAAMMDSLGIKVPESLEGTVTVYVARERVFLGYVCLKDAVREGSKPLLESLSRRGVETVLLSGDKRENVAAFASQLGIAHYEAELLPEGKLERLNEAKQRQKGTLVYLGDGINDAPCLSRADVGVAMGGIGSALAAEEADVLLLNDDPMGLERAIKASKLCQRTIIVNIVFALAVKLAVLLLAMLLGEKMPMEVAVLADTGVSLLATLYSLLLLSRKL